MPHLERLVYVDDSGRPQSGRVVFGWIAFAPDHWPTILARWLETRERLWRDHGIPVTQELHTTDYVHGRGRISRRIPDRHRHAGVDHWKDFGRDVAITCLETLRSMEGLSIGAVHRAGPAAEFARTKHQGYAALVERFEMEFEAADCLGMVFMDGDGTDASLRSAHRRVALRCRRVIEDAIPLDSRHSQLIQMADLVAWCANATVDRHPTNEFAWTWYADYLSPRDTLRAPRAI